MAEDPEEEKYRFIAIFVIPMVLLGVVYIFQIVGYLILNSWVHVTVAFLTTAALTKVLEMCVAFIMAPSQASSLIRLVIAIGKLQRKAIQRNSFQTYFILITFILGVLLRRVSYSLLAWLLVLLVVLHRMLRVVQLLQARAAERPVRFAEVLDALLLAVDTETLSGQAGLWIARGPGMITAEVGCRTYFNIALSRCGFLASLIGRWYFRQQLVVSVTGDGDIVPDITLMRGMSLGFTVSYEPRKVGTCEVSVTMRGQHVTNSPFLVSIVPGRVSGDHCKVVGPGLASPDAVLVVLVNEESSVVIETADFAGNKRTGYDWRPRGASEVSGGLAGLVKMVTTRSVPLADLSLFASLAGGYSSDVSGSSFDIRSRLSSFDSVSGLAIEEIVPSIVSSGQAGLPLTEEAVDYAIDYNVIDLLDGAMTLTFTCREEGLFNVRVMFGDASLKNGTFSLLVISPSVDDNVRSLISAGVCVFRAEKLGLAEGDEDASRLPVTILLRQRQLVIKQYFGPLKIFSRRLFNARVRQRLKVRLDPLSPDCLSVRDRRSALRLRFQSAEDRNSFYCSFVRFLQLNIGCSSEAFVDKKIFFETQVRQLHTKANPSSVKYKVTVSRGRVLESAVRALGSLDARQWRRSLFVVFEGEEGIDAGGVSKEFFQLLARDLLSTTSGIFAVLGDSRATLAHPNRYWRSAIQARLGEKITSPSPLAAKAPDYFRLAGMVLAKVIYDGVVYQPMHLNVHFTRSFYKLLLGNEVSYHDLETDMPELYASQIKYLLKHKINDGADLELYFEEVEVGPDGAPQYFPLKANGASIAVTDANKMEFIQLLAEQKLRDSVSKEVDSFLEGFYSILPEELVSVFDEFELELLISGVPEVSALDLLEHVSWSGFETGDEEPQWFATAVKSLTREERIRLVQFVTGSSQLPANGFADLNPPLRVKYWRNRSVKDHLPRASTCFHTILLPRYSSYDKLQARLVMAVTEGVEGFAFA